MFRLGLVLMAAMLAAAPPGDRQAILHTTRSSPGDLEIGGELDGVPAGETRYLRYEDLLHLPQETYTVPDDANFRGKTEISGVALSALAEMLGNSAADMIVAVCYDHYRTSYPKDYLAAHHPVLVLRINGQDREHWPAAPDGGPMAPYLISHPEFKPSFKVLSHEDEPQIPYGVVRIEIRRKAEVFAAIRPAGTLATDSPVGMGYVIARQDCFRCHNSGAEGGTMAGKSWQKLGEMAERDPSRFRGIIRDPAAVTPGAKMPGQPGYDDATLDALTAYFKSFAGRSTNAAAGRKDSTQ